MKTLNQIRDEAHKLAKEKGWHSFEETNNQFRMRAILLMHSELSELVELLRNETLHSQCDKPIDLTCEEEEIADVFIRAFDYCGRMKIDIDRAIKLKHDYNKTRSIRHGDKKA